MQRTFVTIALALTLSCAFATYNYTNFVKNPVAAVPTNDTTYSKAGNAIFTLQTAINNLLYIQTANYTMNATTNLLDWSTYLQQITLKDLSLSSTMSLNWSQPSIPFYYNNWIISISLNTTTKDFNVYQQPLGGGAAQSAFNLTGNVYNTLAYVSTVVYSDNVYVFYTINTTTLAATSFTAGKTNPSATAWNLTGNYGAAFQATTGDALSGKILATWTETNNTVTSLIEGVITTSGALTRNVVGNWTTGLTCRVFVTDKSNYGELCWNTTSNVNVLYVNVNSAGNLVYLTNVSTSWTVLGQYSYAQYLAISMTYVSGGATNYTIGIWDVVGLKSQKDAQQIVYTDASGNVQLAKVPGGGLFALLYNSAVDGYYQNVTVGLVLAGSYLTTVFGFIVAIVAGLFVF